MRINLFLCFALMVFVTIEQAWADETASTQQDGRNIEKLEWYAIDGSLPGTLEEYLEKHPLTPAKFSSTPQRYLALSPMASGTSGISILVDATLFTQIQSQLNTYVNDLTIDGYSVYVDTVSGGTPADIKAWVATRYAAGSEGVIFIGDITVAWAEVSGDVFPSDLYYMDIDGTWLDADGDGDFEYHTAGSGDEGPELYVARLYATTLTWDSEANMVRGYLAKTTQYRDGVLKQPWRGLEYIDKDWYDMDVALGDIYDPNVERNDLGYWTTADGYLDSMSVGRHFVQVCAHSWSGGHAFSRFPTESVVYAHTYVYSPVARNARLYVGADDGIKVWLNGNVVMNRDYHYSWTPDQYVASVSLNIGWNQLLCKTSQSGGEFQFSARFTDTSGNTIDDLEYCISDPASYTPQAPYINGWLVNGFHQDVSDNFWSYLSTNYLGVSEASLQPYEGEITGGKVWTLVENYGSFVDLDEYSNESDFGASYAYTTITADTTKRCQLWLGYDDGIRVWLNGSNIFTDNTFGDCIPDSSKINVILNPGTNRLLVKVSEWMGTNGFTARLANSDGSIVNGLTYNPGLLPISYIDQWLLNGPYANEDSRTLLQVDYLGGEATVAPDEGDLATLNSWEVYRSGGYPVQLGAFYDHGATLESADIQAADPPVLFYNLFSCSAGLFTDTNYIAGSYIFNTTYGLVTVASSKTGSMLNFHDFTQPLSEAKTIGQAFLEWFDDQAPYVTWEREWYYGMILNGDPTLRLYQRADTNCDGIVDVFDIDPFVIGLVDSAQYEVTYPNCDHSLVDVNRDGIVDVFDIDPFIQTLVGSN